MRKYAGVPRLVGSSPADDWSRPGPLEKNAALFRAPIATIGDAQDRIWCKLQMSPASRPLAISAMKVFTSEAAQAAAEVLSAMRVPSCKSYLAEPAR